MDGEGGLGDMKYSMSMNNVGRVLRGRPTLTWDADWQNGPRVKGLSRDAALDHMAWRDATR